MSDFDDEDEEGTGLPWFDKRAQADEPVVQARALKAVIQKLHDMLPERAQSRRDRKVMFGALLLQMVCDVVFLNATGYENRFAATQFARYAWVVGHCTRIEEMDARKALVEALPGLFNESDEEEAHLKELYLSEVLQFDPHDRSEDEE